MDMILQAELKEYLNLYNKKTLTFLQLAFLFIYGSKSQTLRSGGGGGGGGGAGLLIIRSTNIFVQINWISVYVKIFVILNFLDFVILF